jgi:hypothetical protein
MNIKFLALTLATIGLQTQAKSFRGDGGDDVFLQSFVQKINSLKSIDAEDIAGETNFSVPEYQGDTKHHAAVNGEVAKTAAIIEQQLAIGMRTNFIYIKEAITQYADDDGIVRDGVVFCNAKDDNGDEIRYTSPNFTPDSKDYATDTENLVSSDGFGFRDNTVNAAGKSRDVIQCGRSNCEEGSFVTLVANRIRSLGYHVTHSDICDSKTTGAGYIGVPTCALEKNNGALNKFLAFKCDAASVVAGNDFYQVKRDCFMITDSSQCSGKCQAAQENGAYVCLPSNNITKSNFGGTCAHNAVDDLSIEKINATSTENVINGVRRVIQYGTQKTKVKTTDVVYVTGSPKNLGCTSLREYVNALNGMAQIAAFRDTNILEAESHWNDIIVHTRSYLKSYAEILNDFYDKSTKIFPVIEFDQLDECPVGNVESENNDLGSQFEPLCDQVDTNTKSTQRALDLESQILIRKRCFCRQGSLGGVTHYNNIIKQPQPSAFELDELYLMTEPPADADCDPLKTMDAPSYYQYCKGNAFDDRTWKKTLQDLLPMKHAIKTFGGFKSTKQTAIYNKLGATLPQHWNATAVKAKVASKPNCGRLVTTSSTTALNSNKGGNCVPFRGMHEILFRLEFETSQNYMGQQRNCTNLFANEKDCRFEQVACRNSDALENTLFGFRQFGYIWDHPMYQTSTSAVKISPVQSELLSTWTNGYNDTDTIAVLTSGSSDQTQNSWSVGSDKLFRLDGGKQQCNINWGSQITGDVARIDAYGSSYEDPYALFEREVQEAIVNVEVAMAAKTKAVENTEELWSKISDELTDYDTSGNTIASDLSYEVAEHFMRITTTDSDDPNVDSLDDGASKQNSSDIPEAMTGSA